MLVSLHDLYRLSLTFGHDLYRLSLTFKAKYVLLSCFCLRTVHGKCFKGCRVPGMPILWQHLHHCTKWEGLVDTNAKLTVIAATRQYLALAHWYAYGHVHIKMTSFPATVYRVNIGSKRSFCSLFHLSLFGNFVSGIPVLQKNLHHCTKLGW